MTDPRKALDRADATSGLERRLWLVAAVEAIMERPIVLVGGAAVDVFTGAYHPTDLDLVGSVSRRDLEALERAGFVRKGRHYRWTFSDNTDLLVEFPDTVLDGTPIRIDLADSTTVSVISPESLIVDRLIQATDGTPVTHDEAVRLVIAVGDRPDWAVVAEDVRSRTIPTNLLETTRTVLQDAGALDLAAWFG